MDGLPGSMSAYAQAERKAFEIPVGPGPAAYSRLNTSIASRAETVAPFDTSATRGSINKSDGPGPIYYPIQKDRRQYGSPLFRWRSRLPETTDFSCSTPVWRKLPDPWAQMTDKCLAMRSKTPRVQFDKYVSNNVPTIYHPLDIRSFVVGVDGRVYPWRMNRKGKNPGAKYDTFKIYTSQSKRSALINFANASARPELFPPTIGPGPAAFFVRCKEPIKGGIFLGQRWNDPDSSAPRLFDQIGIKAEKEQPIETINSTMPSSFDKVSPKAVLGPFKSKTPQGLDQSRAGPGPADYFVRNMEEKDLKIKLQPGLTTFPPEKVPFDTTEERLLDPTEINNYYLPGPADYTILSFSDEMQRDLIKHEAAIPNPKLGFLTSADARPKVKLVEETKKGDEGPTPCIKGDRHWRNIRPKKGQTYVYFGAPPRYPDSPGPIYDSNPGTAATKSQKSWLDSRVLSRNAFLNSGCSRKTDFYNIDLNTPGPGRNMGRLSTPTRYIGRQPCPGPRFLIPKNDSPGPVHKLHEKADSSIWRASHLGTFNRNLKQVGILYPTAGGFHKENLTKAGDKVWKIKRKDDYASFKCPIINDYCEPIPIIEKTRNQPRKEE